MNPLSKKETQISEYDFTELVCAAKLKLAQAALQDWIDKQGHDRCWYYPEIFRKLCDILEVKQTVECRLPERSEFVNGCKQYQDEEYLHSE